MKKLLFIFGILSTLATTPVRTYASFHPIDGAYWGFIAGAQYMNNFNNVQLPAMTIVESSLTAPFSATYRNSIGFGGDINFGYRIFERIRGEAEVFYGYQKINSIQAADGTPVSPRRAEQYPNSGNKLLGNLQSYGVMANAYVDLFWDRPDSESTFTPFVGGGAGYGRIQVSTVIDRSTQNPDDVANGQEIFNLSQSSQNQFVWQGMAGCGWSPDDFTFWGIEFRYQNFGTLQALNGKAITYGANLFMSFSFS